MRESDDLATLTTDFQTLSASQRLEILNALKTFERAQFSALLETGADRAAERSQPDDLARFSPWLRDLIHVAAQEPGDVERLSVTPRTRTLIIDLANSPWDRLGDEVEDRIEPPRSLFDRMTAFVLKARIS